MKILLVTLVFLAFGANAQIKAPTVYGKLNKMIRYIDQDDTAYKSFNGVEDGGTPSRIGIKGNLSTSNTKVNYVLEMGFDSEGDGTNAGLSIRRAAFNMDWGMGKLTFGQEWTVTALVGIKLDPLTETGATLWGVDVTSADIGNGTASNVGFISQGRKEQISYETPEIAGFKLAVGTHRGDEESRKPGDSGVNINDTLEALLSYKLDMGSLKADIYAGYISTHGDGTVTTTPVGLGGNKDNSMLFGAKFGMGDFALTGMYTKQDYENTDGTETNKKYMMATAAYKMGDGTIAFTYGNRTDETTTETKRNQMALGYLYDINKHVQLNAYGSLYKYEMGAAKNDATIFGLGARLNF